MSSAPPRVDGCRPALVAVAPHKRIKGFDGVRTEVPLAYEVLELCCALERRYPTDAHLVTYVVRGAKRQPRINKAGLPHFDGVVEVGVFFCDVDNEGHSPWDEALHEAALEQYESLEVLRTAGIYHTKHGRRIVQPIAEPIPAAQVEPYIRRWLLGLEAAGLPVDWACRDWTRHFRLPNVCRDGKQYDSPFIFLKRMRPIELEPIPEPELVESSDESSGSPVPVPHLDWSVDIPEHWQTRVKQLAAAVREVATPWHRLFLSLSGALLSRGVPPELLPAIIWAVSVATSADDKTDDRVAGAKTTAARRLADRPATGYGELVRSWPAVAEVFDEVMARGGEARLRAQAKAVEQAPPKSLDQVTSELHEAIRSAPDGVTLISAECGLGKTRAAIHVAAERAVKTHASPSARGVRAPLGSKTAISVDKNDLALQVVDDLLAVGVRAQRLFGPLSIKDDKGVPVCRYHEVARPLVNGGQTMQWELCEGRGLEPCEVRFSCPVRHGFEGPDDARVVVGTHALLSRLASAAGSTGLLVIDEPPDLLETTLLSLDELESTDRLLPAFEEGYGAAMHPALLALTSWVRELSPLAQPTTLAQAVLSAASVVEEHVMDDACEAVGGDVDAVQCAILAPLPSGFSQAPPIDLVYLRRAKRSKDYAIKLGAASGVLNTIYRALVEQRPVAARVEQVGGERTLLITQVRDQLYRAVTREGAVVVTDAKTELLAPILAKAVGYQPPSYSFSVPDGAPITRTLIRRVRATRKAWLPGRKLALTPSLVNAVRAVIDWACEDPSSEKLGIITFLPLEIAIAATLDPGNAALAGTWKSIGQEPKTLRKAREALGPILSAWKGDIVLGHYGGIRGLNTMEDLDCLATLGDPWPNVGQVRNELAFMGFEGDEDARMTAKCEAELEQAHGRLRPVHRTRPGRALHIGSVLPAGYGWTMGEVAVRPSRGGRPKHSSAMTVEELVRIITDCGGLRATARLIGKTHGYLSQCKSGKCPISDDLARDLRALHRR